MASVLTFMAAFAGVMLACFMLPPDRLERRSEQPLLTAAVIVALIALLSAVGLSHDSVVDSLRFSLPFAAAWVLAPRAVPLVRARSGRPAKGAWPPADPSGS